MTVCIPTMGDRGLDEAVHGHFGSAQYFYLYDTEKDEIEKIDNGNLHHAHGMCQPLASLEGRNVSAVLTAGIGRRALQLLNAQGIKVFRTEGEVVRDAVVKIKEGSLEELTPEHSCQGHGCH